jgi:hypothetical protein
VSRIATKAPTFQKVGGREVRDAVGVRSSCATLIIIFHCTWRVRASRSAGGNSARYKLPSRARKRSTQDRQCTLAAVACEPGANMSVWPLPFSCAAHALLDMIQTRFVEQRGLSWRLETQAYRGCFFSAIARAVRGQRFRQGSPNLQGGIFVPILDSGRAAVRSPPLKLTLCHVCPAIGQRGPCCVIEIRPWDDIRCVAPDTVCGGNSSGFLPKKQAWGRRPLDDHSGGMLRQSQPRRAWTSLMSRMECSTQCGLGVGLHTWNDGTPLTGLRNTISPQDVLDATIQASICLGADQPARDLISWRARLHRWRCRVSQLHPGRRA